MKLTSLVLATLPIISYVRAKAVFAHFMVGNTQDFTIQDWHGNIELAQNASIDAFALNIAAGWPPTDASLSLAFQAANDASFALFFSFDYDANGSWAKSDVADLIQQYGSNRAYYQYQGKPFVSTFEGTDSAKDWIDIKSKVDCFFVPDWSSVEPASAVGLGNDVADGLFNWEAWPSGTENMTTFADASYMTLLGNKPYMMPVSPWFYTNLPGYKKNWLWHTGDLWYERWKQVWYMEPEFVEILTWNDFGESHYIGPLNDKEYVAFTQGDALYNYAEDMPHGAWRTHLPFLINTYEYGQTSSTEESLTFWFRPTFAAACDTGGTTGDTPSQHQTTVAPQVLSPDMMYFSLLLREPASLKIMSTKADQVIQDWDYTPDGGIGIYHTSIPVVEGDNITAIQVLRGSDVVMNYVVTEQIGTSCTDNVTNWNAWVGGMSVDAGGAFSPPLNLSKQVCVSGWGEAEASELCSFSCQYGYCPTGECVCTNMGQQVSMPKTDNVQGFPVDCGDDGDSGLCDFACKHGFCPPSACTTTQPTCTSTSSPTPSATGKSSARRLYHLNMALLLALSLCTVISSSI